MPVHHSLLTPQGGEEPERAALQMLESQGGLSVDRVDMLLLTGDQIYADGISASRLRITLPTSSAQSAWRRASGRGDDYL